MAITLDANLGTNQEDGNDTNVALTTSASAAANSFITLGITWNDNVITLTGVSGGGLTWSIDAQGFGDIGGGSSSNGVAVVSAQAPSGLASSTVITATFSGSVGAKTIGGTSWLGVKTSSPVDAVGGVKAVNGSTAWDTESTACAAGSLLYTVCWARDTGTGSTPTSPSLEAWEDNDTTNGYGAVAGYRIEAGAGSYVVEGTWGATAIWANMAVAYLAAAGGAAPPVPTLRTVQSNLRW